MPRPDATDPGGGAARARFSVVRHSAAIVYEPDGPKIVVLLTYAPNLDFATAEASGARLVRLLGL